MAEDPFAGRAAFFVGHYQGTRGRLRLELVLERLLEALPPPPARVLDAGGGTGAFAIPLAERGYDVTILDQSEEWLSEAERGAGESGARLHAVHGNVEDAPELTPGPFDAILCHTVLIYAERLAEVLRALRTVASPGAVLSSLEKNRHALAVRPAREGDYAEALRVMDDPWASGRLGVRNRALTSGELRGAMVATGWLPTGWAGIRVFSDGAPEVVDPATFETLRELDREAAVREPDRRFGRLLHVMARAWEPEPLAVLQERSFERATRGTLGSWPPERSLVPDRLIEFLERTRYAALSTTRPDGRPHATMVAHCLRDGRVWLPAVASAQRVRNLMAEPSASMLFTDGEGDDHVVVLMEGQAAVHADPAPILDGWLRQAWLERHGTELDWAGAIIELIPTKVLSYAAQ